MAVSVLYEGTRITRAEERPRVTDVEYCIEGTDQKKHEQDGKKPVDLLLLHFNLNHAWRIYYATHIHSSGA